MCIVKGVGSTSSYVFEVLVAHMPLYTFSLMQSFHSIQKRLGQMYSHLHSKGLSPSYEFKVLVATMLMYDFLIDAAIP